MTETEQYEYLKTYDFTSLILLQNKRDEYPLHFEMNAYYGFYLLAAYVGKLLLCAKKMDGTVVPLIHEGQSDYALSYLESNASLQKNNPFARSKPFTYQIVHLLENFISNQDSENRYTNYSDYAEQVHVLIKRIESSRTSDNLLRSLDIFLARRWCRLLRIYILLTIPEKYYPQNYSFERDMNISAKRGIKRQDLLAIRFRIRFQKLCHQEKAGKLILLAEEWEVLCLHRKLDADPHEYELLVLDHLDTELHFKIGLEWVTMLSLRHPEYKHFKIWEARFLRRDGKNEKALQICQNLLMTNPLDYEIYCLQSNLLFLDGRYKEAQKSALIATSCGEEYPETHIALAYSYLYDGQYDDAVAAFDAAISLDATQVDAYRGKSKALIMDGQAYESMQCLVTVSRISPKDADIFHDLADVYFMCGYLEECKKYCQKCLSIDPHCAGAYVLLGMLEIRKNHEKNAGKWLHRALELEPLNPIALNELAYVQHLNGNDEECLTLLHKAIEIAPDFPDVLCSMGVVYYYQSEFDDALTYFDRTLDIDSMHIGALVGKGNLYLAQSDAEEALVWFDQAIICDPEYPEAIFGKVNAYRAMGLEKEAFEWTQKASDMIIDGDDDE
jgi:tetratricopeptide (TPR) repeat protein